MPTQPAFSPWLRQLRIERDLTQERLADLAGCAAETIRALESGRRRPSLQLAGRLARLLELPPEERDQFIRLARAGEPAETPPQPPEPAARPHPGALLATKLFASPLPPRGVTRSRLLTPLADQAARLTMLVAPPGFGKSTLLAQLAALPAAAAPRFAWLSLDEQDDDPARFLTYLIAALGRVAPEVAASAAAQHATTPPPPPQVVVASLINALHASPVPLALVLDDYHTITSPAVHDLLTTLVERAPPGLRLLIAARSDPPLPLARWRARGLLSELRAAELRFDRAEAAAFLLGSLDLALSADQVSALEARTEGWAAGLQLAALSLRGRADADDFIAAFGGSNRYVLDYLAGETLAALPAHLRTFLLQTAPLRRLCGPLCDAVLGIDGGYGGDGSYSALLLGELERRNLFLIPLDDTGLWWRYHHLFADMLQVQLRAGASGAEVAALHARAARWYDAAGEDEEALHHAEAAGDLALAGALLERAAPRLVDQGALATLLRRLRGLPREVITARPALVAHAVWALVEAGDADTAEAIARAAVLPPEATPADEGYLLGARARVALVREAYEASEAQARAALAAFGEADPSYRARVLATLAGACESRNDLPGALAAARASAALSRAIGEDTLAADMLVSNALSMQGRAAEAEAYVVEALAARTDSRGAVVPTASALLVILGRLRLDQGWIAESRALVVQGRELAETHGFTYGALYANAMLLFIERCGGDLAAARATARRLRRLAEQTGTGYWLRVVDGLDAELALLAGDAAPAVAWAEGVLAELRGAAPVAARQTEYALSCLFVLTSAGRAAAALPLATQLLAELRAAGRWRGVLFLELYEALCLHGLGRTGEAREALARAVRRAESQGAMSVFLVAPAALGALLPAVRDAAPAFVDRLLTWLREGPGPDGDSAPPAPPGAPAPPGLIEPLSGRELEVLQLLATGRSNQAIADELLIAVGTVKRHLNNIFGKLGAASRTEAIARAHALGLLGR